MELLIKYALSAAIVVAVSELGRRVSWAGALLASLPLTSVLAMIWLWRDTGDPERIAQLSTGIFWLVLPSLALFIALPLMLRRGADFYFALLAACAIMALSYFAMLTLLRRAGVSI